MCETLNTPERTRVIDHTDWEHTEQDTFLEDTKLAIIHMEHFRMKRKGKFFNERLPLMVVTSPSKLKIISV